MNAVRKLGRNGLKVWYFYKILKVADKKNAMIIYGGNEIARLKNSLPDPETGDMYTKLYAKLKAILARRRKNTMPPNYS